MGHHPAMRDMFEFRHPVDMNAFMDLVGDMMEQKTGLATEGSPLQKQQPRL